MNIKGIFPPKHMDQQCALTRDASLTVSSGAIDK